jgi:hypothetical protein
MQRRFRQALVDHKCRQALNVHFGQLMIVVALSPRRLQRKDWRKEFVEAAH